MKKSQSLTDLSEQDFHQLRETTLESILNTYGEDHLLSIYVKQVKVYNRLIIKHILENIKNRTAPPNNPVKKLLFHFRNRTSEKKLFAKIVFSTYKKQPELLDDSLELLEKIMKAIDLVIPETTCAKELKLLQDFRRMAEASLVEYTIAKEMVCKNDQKYFVTCWLATESPFKFLKTNRVHWNKHIQLNEGKYTWQFSETSESSTPSLH